MPHAFEINQATYPFEGGTIFVPPIIFSACFPIGKHLSPFTYLSELFAFDLVSLHHE
jgi:hypothetical protein